MFARAAQMQATMITTQPWWESCFESKLRVVSKINRDNRSLPSSMIVWKFFWWKSGKHMIIEQLFVLRNHLNPFITYTTMFIIEVNDRYVFASKSFIIFLLLYLFPEQNQHQGWITIIIMVWTTRSWQALRITHLTHPSMKGVNVLIVEPSQLPFGEGMALDTISVMHVVCITRWTELGDLWLNLREDW